MGELMQTQQPLTVIDGGMGGELIRREATPRDGLWSAQALLEAPELVAEVHRDYVAAGARVIITNTYSTIPSYLGKAGLADRYLELADLAGRIAREVADGAEQQVRVAGSIPPLEDSYRADLVPAAEVSLPIYRELARALRPHVDLYVCETMSSIDEAKNAVSAAREVGGADVPIWVSWTLAEDAGGGLRSGESIADAYSAIAEYDVGACLFNCTTPAAITAGLKELRAITDLPIGAYPNQLHIPEGWTLDNEVATGYSAITTDEYVEFARGWRATGATLIGGCCGVGPEYIEALSKALA